MSFKTIYIACDHAGLPLKTALMAKNSDLPWKDLGTHGPESVDYPDFAKLLVKNILAESNSNSVGILICGSGQGMAISANRNAEIRAALCWTPEVAQLARAHNNANVLCLGARIIDVNNAHEILNTFLQTPFEGGRHESRVAKLTPKN